MKPMVRFQCTLLTCLLWGLGAVSSAAADESEDKARAILQQQRSAVITVRLIVKEKFSMMGMDTEESESKIEITGTIIAPDGLTVLSLSDTDPTSMYQSLFGDGMDDEDMHLESEVTDVVMLLQDGAELPAKIVLRDKDLDLAFLRPRTQPASPLAFLDLSVSAEPQVFDRLVTFGRLGTVANRTHGAGFGYVGAIVAKPRVFYVPAGTPEYISGGCPAFDLEGKPIGIFVLRVIKNTSGPGGMYGGIFSDSIDNMLPIILPCADILEGAAQAPGVDAVAEPSATEKTPSPAETVSPDTNANASTTAESSSPALPEDAADAGLTE